jgi:hypothetical protein
VQIGDVVHAVNGASVVLLPPSVAGRVIAKQERPLHVTFSTTGPARPAKLSPALARVQRELLAGRLTAFYQRHGPSKVDKVHDILDLYATHEQALFRGLAFKYGEHVPGDGEFAPEFCQVTAQEAVSSLTKSRRSGGLLFRGPCPHPMRRRRSPPPPRVMTADTEDVFIDCRAREDRMETGFFPASFLAGPEDADKPETWQPIQKALQTRTGLPRHVRVCLIGSGRENIYALADPKRAMEEQASDAARMRQVQAKLWALGVPLVCAVRGGFADCVRECAARQVDAGVDGGALGGAYRRACDAYAAVDFENTASVARFLCAHVTNFEPPREDQDLDLDPLNIGEGLNKLASALPPVNLNPLNLSLPPAGKFSLSGLGGLAKSASSQSMSSTAGAAAPPADKDSASNHSTPTNAASLPPSPAVARQDPPPQPSSRQFSIDDDAF